MELVEEEVRDVLEEYGFDRETPIIKGSAFNALADGASADDTKCIDELLSTMDNYFDDPERASDKPFLMPIEDIFTISGRGTVVTGRIERGIVNLNEEIEIIGIKDTKKTVITGIEMFNKLLDQGVAGDNVGLLRGVDKKEVERGQVLAKPGSITPTPSLKLRSTFFPRMKVDVTVRSSPDTARSSTSGQLTLPEPLRFLTELTWSSPVTTPRSLVS